MSDVSDFSALTVREYLHAIFHAAEHVDIAKALQVSKKALVAYPDSGELLYLAGSLYGEMGMYDESIDFIGRSLPMIESPLAAQMHLGLIHFMCGDFDEADRVWQAMPIDDAHAFRLFQRGFNHLIKDEFEPSVLYLTQGMEVNTVLPWLNDEVSKVIDKINALPQGERSFNFEQHRFRSGYGAS